MTARQTTFNVIFHLRNLADIDGKYPVYMRITVYGKRIEFSAKQMISLDDWNENSGMARTKKKKAGH